MVNKSSFRNRWLTICVCAVALISGTTGCDSDEPTEFPSGLEPLEVCTAPAPDPIEGDATPEDVRFVLGTEDEYSWVHGRGFVHKPLAETWAAMRDPEVSVDRREVDEWTVEHGVETEYDFSYVIHNTVNDIITVEFDITWRQGVVEGTVEAPELVGGRFQKTFGTTFIELLSGSIVARAVDDSTTEIELIEHLKATGKGADTAQSFLRDYFTSVVAKAHGNPLPTYE